MRRPQSLRRRRARGHSGGCIAARCPKLPSSPPPRDKQICSYLRTPRLSPGLRRATPAARRSPAPFTWASIAPTAVPPHVTKASPPLVPHCLPGCGVLPCGFFALGHTTPYLCASLATRRRTSPNAGRRGLVTSDETANTISQRRRATIALRLYNIPLASVLFDFALSSPPVGTTSHRHGWLAVRLVGRGPSVYLSIQGNVRVVRGLPGYPTCQNGRGRATHERTSDKGIGVRGRLNYRRVNVLSCRYLFLRHLPTVVFLTSTDSRLKTYHSLYHY